jgi:hypothetical protein
VPYHIRSTGHGMAEVVKTATGEPMSKHPIPMARAKRQLAALYANEPVNTRSAQRKFQSAREKVR